MKIEIPENTAFAFSAVDPETIQNLEDEYTLVSIAEDVSPSTNMLRDEMCQGMKTVNLACKKAPRADKVMLHCTRFGSRIEEIHGFKPVNDIDENDYTPSASIGGSTCLYDAIFNAVAAVARYAEILDKSDIGSNAIIFILTDGMDNSSSLGVQSILDKIEEIKMKEILESVKIIIIGFNDPKSGYAKEVAEYLENLCKELNLDQYVDVGSMTPEAAAKVFGFVSQSISAQSQHLGTGGASQNLTF
jgi:uncharacterized protein YegL